MLVRPATEADLPAMIALERESPTAAHWTEQQYRQLFSPVPGDPQRLAVVIEEESTVLGFLVAHQIQPEWELENVMVSPAERRRGWGARLLEELVARARTAKSEAIFLEVRESNQSARALYIRAGFKEIGRRKSYYSAPTEDAVLYRLALR